MARSFGRIESTSREKERAYGVAACFHGVTPEIRPDIVSWRLEQSLMSA